MQIKFTPKKLQEANKYVDLLTPTKKELIKTKEKHSLLKKIVKLLFK